MRDFWHQKLKENSTENEVGNEWIFPIKTEYETCADATRAFVHAFNFGSRTVFQGMKLPG